MFSCFKIHIINKEIARAPEGRGPLREPVLLKVARTQPTSSSCGTPAQISKKMNHFIVFADKMADIPVFLAFSHGLREENLFKCKTTVLFRNQTHAIYQTTLLECGGPTTAILAYNHECFLRGFVYQNGHEYPVHFCAKYSGLQFGACSYDGVLVLETTGKADEIGANAKAGAPASGTGHGGDKDVEHAKGGGGREGDDDHLFDLETLLGNGIGGNGHHETLDNVLDGALDEFGKIKDVAHGSSIS